MIEEITVDKGTEIMVENGYGPDQFSGPWATWIERGDIVLIFENADLGHRRVGHLITMPWAADDALPPHAPDHHSIGLGWRYPPRYVIRSR